MKKIRLENFRCYTDQSIDFRPGINLLIGDNASGKTTVLKACKYILSSFFSGFSDENTKWISPSSGDFTTLVRNGIIMPEKPIKLHFICNPDMYERLPHEDYFYNPGDNEEEYTLQKNSRKNSRALVSGITDYKDYADLLYKKFFDDEKYTQVHALPLFAYFSSEDIHASRKIDSDKFKSYAQKSSFGYYECLDGNGFFPFWMKRLLVLREGEKNLEEIEIVRQAIITALGIEGCRIINDIDIRPNKKEIYYILADGREVRAEDLSDGYKRLVNIITDLAFRCALLNRGIYRLQSASLTKGTVLIDEMDLHLHPTLQSSVLKGLQRAFPNMQFIVTTHAPMVMTGVESTENNIVYKLSYSSTEGYQIIETQTYGLDSSTITEVVLNQIPRDINVDEKLTMLFSLIDEERNEEARRLLNELKEQFEDNLPELSNAEAMLNFSIEDNDAENC